MQRSDAFAQTIRQLPQTPSYDAYHATANVIDGMTAEESSLPPLRLAVLRNFTIDPLLPILKSEIARMGFFPCLLVGGHDTIVADVMDPASGLYRFNPDVIIIAQWLEAIAPMFATRFISFSEQTLSAEVQRIVDAHVAVVRAVRQRSNAPILLNNFPLPEYPALGILDAQREHWQTHTMLRLHQELLRQMQQFPDVYIVDYAHLMARMGTQQGYNERYWHIGKMPFSHQALAPFGMEYMRFLRALMGKARKCLILDCDNTLWGGILGEEGIEGIALGSTYPGSCYVSFQREIMNLHDRGVVLALCSKNNERDVLEVLDRHPSMVLRKECFAARQINWDDKATNIRRIVEQLGIGMESVVFADDSAFEIGLVQSQLPDITVLHLPSEASQLRAAICARGHFDTLVFSDEDRARNRMYRDEVHRKQLATSAGSMEEYLAKLEIRIRIGRTDAFHVPRVAQLTQKTNQFNLTTKRYTEGDITRWTDDTQCDVLYAQLQDTIADMGTVGMAMIRYAASVADIDSFLLSCRALGRGVEDALLAHVVLRARANGCTTVCGRYIPTSKNEQVADFYARHGFVRQGDESHDVWELEVARATCTTPNWITVDVVDQPERAYAVH